MDASRYAHRCAAVLSVLLAAVALPACMPGGAAHSNSLEPPIERSPSPDAPSSAASSTSSPMPATSRPRAHEAVDVEGTFNGDFALMANCTWVTDDTGERWELAEPLPGGYAAGFDGRTPILTHEGDVVARAGDRLGLNGVKDPPDLGSFCMVGRVFLVTDVVWIERADGG
jgi:hypothetical protein